MCQSKAQGGKRCFGHALASLQGGLDERDRARVAQRAAHPDNSLAREDWDDLEARTAAWDVYNEATAAFMKTQRKVETLRRALLRTERGALEAHALADAYFKACRNPAVGVTSDRLFFKGQSLRARAISGGTGRPFEQVATEISDATGAASKWRHTVQRTQSGDGWQKVVPRERAHNGEAQSIPLEPVNITDAEYKQIRRDGLAAEQAAYFGNMADRKARLGEMRAKSKRSQPIYHLLVDTLEVHPD